jgi:hypothetical protein
MKTPQSEEEISRAPFCGFLLIFVAMTFCGCDTPEGSNAAAALFRADAALATNSKQAAAWGVLSQTAATDAQMQNQREVAAAGRPQVQIIASPPTPISPSPSTTSRPTYIEQFRLDNGAIYTGGIEWFEENRWRPAGRGYLENFKNTGGEIYTGSGYENDTKWLRDGEGTLTWPNGQKYTGSWYYDKMEGQGTMTWPNGGKYTGTWHNDRIAGHGTGTMEDGSILDGEWADDQLFKGKKTMPDGRTWEGEFEDALVKGNTYLVKGRFRDSLGTELTGVWKSGHQDLEGTDVWPDGTKYVGVWKEGGKSGGTITWRDGREYKGDWEIIVGKPDLPDGEGTMTWLDGRKYTGGFMHGKMQGNGKMAYADGKVEEGIWRDGQFEGPESQASQPRPSPNSDSNSGSGFLNVTAEGASFEVFADGAFVGNSPAKLKLPAGTHVIEVKKAGFKDYKKQITLLEGSELNLQAVLEME